ncbi:NUDIX domain-containing protein [Erythrobacter litoralis]|uniref:MutT/nudix family protein n=1 Tax=Erythrobacter litoralis (strain HTCC2594) TaxID=314225 RepID=Q2N8B5_ERYLH|nr:NUDIX domain-containing protein [Erythrobacter litoralis]ABC64076.1 MutT/nudix family protein [Erythrobacter litoralis HTCC2594]
MLRLIPASVQRALMPLAHAVRHRWRMWRKTHLYGISVIITDFDGSLLLLRHSYGPQSWALPGGGVNSGEDAADAAKREVSEELSIDLPRVELVGTLEETISGSPHTCYLFFAQTDIHPTIDRREVIEARFFPSHSLPEPMIENTRRRIEAWRASTR